MTETSRRAFIGLITGTAGMGLSGAAMAADICLDMAKLSGGERSLRRSLNFKEVSPDPKRSCSGCSFFTTSRAGAACGKCALLSGGPVTEASVCDNWTARG